MANDQLTRFFGGSPATGAGAPRHPLRGGRHHPRRFGDRPAQHLRQPRRLRGQQFFDLGFGTMERVWRYFLLGAVVVIPLWLLMRLLSGFRR